MILQQIKEGDLGFAGGQVSIKSTYLAVKWWLGGVREYFLQFLKALNAHLYILKSQLNFVNFTDRETVKYQIFEFRPVEGLWSSQIWIRVHAMRI